MSFNFRLKINFYLLPLHSEHAHDCVEIHDKTDCKLASTYFKERRRYHE